MTDHTGKVSQAHSVGRAFMQGDMQVHLPLVERATAVLIDRLCPQYDNQPAAADGHPKARIPS